MCSVSFGSVMPRVTSYRFPRVSFRVKCIDRGERDARPDFSDLRLRCQVRRTTMNRTTMNRLGGAVALLITTFGAGCTSTTTAQSENVQESRSSGLYVVTLGTAAGRTTYGGSEAAGISTAVVVDGDVYVVDFGAGWLRRYQQSRVGRSAPAGGLQDLRAAFVTHLHADHVADFAHLFLFGGSEGLATKHSPVQIFGPGNRGKLPAVTGGDPGNVPIVNAASPTPGLKEMIDRLFDAYATDVNDNIRDSRRPDPRSQLLVQDIELPAGLVADPNVDVAPSMNPIAVYADDKVRVTAILVEHAPVFPTFAYRFDTARGSVVISGDTAPSENLIKLAKGADILVHEVIDTAWVDSLFPSPRTAAQEAKAHHLVEAHTAVGDVGKVAEAAGVKVLVLSHLAPVGGPDSRWQSASSGYSGRVVVAHDRQWISAEGAK